MEPSEKRRKKPQERGKKEFDPLSRNTRQNNKEKTTTAGSQSEAKVYVQVKQV